VLSLQKKKIKIKDGNYVYVFSSHFLNVSGEISLTPGLEGNIR
jgi:hypothetical protein